MRQEGVKSLSGPLLRRQAPPPPSLQTTRKRIASISVMVSGRRPVPNTSTTDRGGQGGVRDDHFGPTGECTAAGGVTGVHKAGAWVESDFMSRSMQGRMWKLCNDT